MKRKSLWATRSNAILIVGGLIILLVVFGLWLFRVGQRRWEGVLRANVAYTTTGTVTDKKKFVFTTEEPYYISDLGDKIQQVPGTVQWRIYYEIENFNQQPEPKRTQLMEAEVKRQQEYGERFYPFSHQEREIYDRTEIGDKLAIHYQYIGDEKDIINIENLTHPRKE